jgi:hypothetical protein
MRSCPLSPCSWAMVGYGASVEIAAVELGTGKVVVEPAKKPAVPKDVAQAAGGLGREWSTAAA